MDKLNRDRRCHVERIREKWMAEYPPDQDKRDMLATVDELAPSPTPLDDKQLYEAFTANAVECEDGLHRLPSVSDRSHLAQRDAAVLTAAAHAWREAARMLRERAR